MIRVLLARGDDDQAAGLARSVTAHRAAALTFVAERTRSKNLLDETIGLATGTDNIEEQAAILLPALRTAANMADRTTAEHLLRRLNTIRKQLSDQPDHTTRHTVTVPYLPKRMGTLTEIAETVERSRQKQRTDARSSHRCALLWAGSSPLPFRKQLARALTIGNWLDIVDRVVEVEPNAYPAIIGELDRLHQREL